MKSFLIILLASLLSASALIAVGCAVNRATGERHLSLTSESQEISMGQQADKDVAASIGVYPDSSLNRFVQGLGGALAAGSERPQLPWTYRVVDDPVVNAFALPGGFIYVTRGILAHLENEAQLAGVMGHETGHVTAQHSVHQMATQQITQLGLGLGVALKPGLEPYAQLAGQGLGLLFLKFSRKDESQADELGVRYMIRQNYDPHQMAEVMRMLERVSESSEGGRVPEWLSTHPDPGNREQHIEALIQANPPATTRLVVNRDSYLRRLNGIIYGANPREGFFKGNTFYHPDLQFRFDFPAGWTTQNQKQGVTGVSSQQDAILQITTANARSADEAARAFFAQAGVTAGQSSSTPVNGLPAVSGLFTAQTDQGAIRGYASFVSYGGDVYQILGYTGQNQWLSYEGAITGAARSFNRLTDPALLSVQPQHLEIVTVKQNLSVAEFNRMYPSGVSADEIALINQVEPGGTFRAGSLVKRVVGKATS